ncbi:myrosinase 1-like [Planococcus citri]|uniref:myrosinase 1-like n=1 Tax=Planococcus citri TaxID=170843 RepID=UPI0031F98362
MKDKIKIQFPEGFLLGVSTASYQIEGAWNEDGKGENIWDRLTHTNPESVNNCDNGDTACDSYHKYKEDVKLIKDIGFQNYRFSISWSRILPNGDLTCINQKGIDYYNRLIDELINNGIEPMVTLYHWDLPQPLQDIGGWLNPLLVDYFEDYARLIFQLYGNKVKWWNTINEPLEIIHGYTERRYAPYLSLDEFGGDYMAGHTLLKAHARAYHVYDKEFRCAQQGKLSITLSGFFHVPKSDSQDDKDAAERANQFELGWFGHPIYSKAGNYPPIMRELVDKRSKEEGRMRSRLPTFTPEEIEEIKGTYDFLAMNHYTSRLSTSGIDPKEKARFRDANFIDFIDENWPVSSSSEWFKVVPWGFRQMFLWLKKEYDNPPVFITENGYCDSGQITDIDRINYFKDYIGEMLNAIHKHQCNIIGYNVWSLLDNFEWTSGYGCKFGIIHVDFKDPERKRTRKLSSKFLHDMIEQRSIPNVDYSA